MFEVGEARGELKQLEQGERESEEECREGPRKYVRLGVERRGPRLVPILALIHTGQTSLHLLFV